jgi:hypothetical protein
MLDPNAGASLRLDEIEALVDDLLAAHRQSLPEGLRGASQRDTRFKPLVVESSDLQESRVVHNR